MRAHGRGYTASIGVRRAVTQRSPLNIRNCMLHGSLDRLFVEQSNRTPDRIALIEGDRSVTYSELDAMSARMAAALRTREIGNGATVGLHADRSLDWVAAMLGILRANAAVMPLPPSYPE